MGGEGAEWRRAARVQQQANAGGGVGDERGCVNTARDDGDNNGGAGGPANTVRDDDGGDNDDVCGPVNTGRGGG